MTGKAVPAARGGLNFCKSGPSGASAAAQGAHPARADRRREEPGPEPDPEPQKEPEPEPQEEPEAAGARGGSLPPARGERPLHERLRDSRRRGRAGSTGRAAPRGGAPPPGAPARRHRGPSSEGGTR